VLVVGLNAVRRALGDVFHAHTQGAEGCASVIIALESAMVKFFPHT
jgi:RNase P protein component